MKKLDINKLRELLGFDVLLLSWPKGTKGTRRPWKHLTNSVMNDPGYLEKLARGNIGVVLGEKSGGLCCIDIDADDFVETFANLNPQLAPTLQTHGARGRVFWVRFKGDYPKRTCKLKSRAGADLGEFRSNGAQSIIAGIHPATGKPYQIVHRAKAVELEFRSIVWPTGIAKPPTLEANSTNCSEDTEDTEDTNDTQATYDTECIPPEGLLSPVRTIEDALRVSLPTGIHANNRWLFTLARAVKTLERHTGKFSTEQLKDIFNEWHTRAVPFLRAGQTKEEYMIEFFNAYRRAKHPFGTGAIRIAWRNAHEQPLPPEAAHFENRQIQLLVAICHQLQIIAGDGPFFLATRICQRLFQHKTHTTAAKWLRALIGMGILEEVEKGGGVRASRYRYVSGPAAMENPKGTP